MGAEEDDAAGGVERGRADADFLDMIRVYILVILAICERAD